jgi:hypothetical protein
MDHEADESKPGTRLPQRLFRSCRRRLENRHTRWNARQAHQLVPSVPHACRHDAFEGDNGNPLLPCKAQYAHFDKPYSNAIPVQSSRRKSSLRPIASTTPFFPDRFGPCLLSVQNGPPYFSRVPTLSASPLLKEKSPNHTRLQLNFSNSLEHAETMFHASIIRNTLAQ